MGNSITNGQLQAIVVGGSSDGFVRYATNQLENYSVRFVRCDDIYSTVGELAKNTGGNVLVMGRFEQLGREQGRFFHILSEKGIFCCCLADGNSARMQRRLDLPELAAKEAAVFVINEQAQIENVIAGLLANDLTTSLCKKENRSADFIKDDFLITKAELNALLET